MQQLHVADLVSVQIPALAACYEYSEVKIVTKHLLCHYPCYAFASMQSNHWWRQRRLSLTLTSRFDPLTRGWYKPLLPYKHSSISWKRGRLKEDFALNRSFCLRLSQDRFSWSPFEAYKDTQFRFDCTLLPPPDEAKKGVYSYQKMLGGKHRFSLMYNENTGKSRESKGKLKQSANCVCWSECQLLWKLQGRWGCQQLLFNNQTHQHRLREGGGLHWWHLALCMCVSAWGKRKRVWGWRRS